LDDGGELFEAATAGSWRSCHEALGHVEVRGRVDGNRIQDGGAGRLRC